MIISTVYLTLLWLQMFRLNLPQDPKEAAAIEARRLREKERQARLLNVRTRVIGVDVDALNKQVEEKKNQKAREQSKEAAFGNDQVKYDIVAQMIETEQAEQSRRLANKIQDFREQKQQFRNQREFDLWDPKQLKKDLPARIGDNDPRCGPSSLQCFAGEDLNRATRLKVQQEQLRHNLDQQLQEQHQARIEEQSADMLNEKLRLAVEMRAAQIAKLEESCRISIMAAIAKANRAQAAEAAQRRRQEHQRQQAANLLDIRKHVTSDLLTENPQVAQHRTDPNRVLPYCWKGMTEKQRTAIRKVQERQRQENELQRQVDHRRDKDLDSQALCLAQAAMELEEQEKELCDEFRRGLGSFNKNMVNEQKAQQNYLNSIVHTNKPAAQYFLQSHMSNH